jgi:ABC-2 type transport system permease protein
MRRSLLGLAAIAVLVGGAYAAVARAGVAWDLTSEGSATLSETTLRVLDGVDRRLHVTAFFPREAPGRVEAATLLSRYRDANRKITFSIIDPSVVPGEIDRLGVEEIGNAAVENLSNDEVEVAQYTIEIDLTSAIARMLRDVEGTVCFEQGHGEREITDGSEDGLSQAADLLTSNGYEVDTIDLLAGRGIDDGCDAVVVAAAKTELGSRARRALTRFLEASGKLLVLADPDASADLTAVTRRWGIRFVGGVVVEGDEGAHLPQDLTAPIVTRYAGGSSVVRGLGPTFFPRTMGIVAEPTDDTGLTVTDLARTSDVSYLDRNDFEEFDPKVDAEGPVVIGASADDSTVERPGTERARIVRTRILAWGDVDFATNGFVTDGDNASLWVQGVDWLTQPEDLVTAVPRFPKLRELDLTAARSRYVLFLMAGVVPGLFLIAGAMVWVVRRSR